MIYLLSAIFFILWYSPLHWLNWHSCIWYWAADNAVYLSDGNIRLDKMLLYFVTMTFFYIGLVVLPSLFSVGIPFVAQMLKPFARTREGRVFLNNLVFLSVDNIKWLSAIYRPQNDRLGWLERSLFFIGLGVLVWQTFCAPILYQTLAVSLFLTPDSSFPAVLLIATSWLGRWEVNFFHTINVAIRQTAQHEL